MNLIPDPANQTVAGQEVKTVIHKQYGYTAEVISTKLIDARSFILGYLWVRADSQYQREMGTLVYFHQDLWEEKLEFPS